MSTDYFQMKFYVTIQQSDCNDKVFTVKGVYWCKSVRVYKHTCIKDIIAVTSCSRECCVLQFAAKSTVLLR